MTEKPAPTQGTEARSYTTITSTGEGDLQLLQIQQASLYNIAQNPTGIKLDIETLD